jgi:hypothetical protein
MTLDSRLSSCKKVLDANSSAFEKFEEFLDGLDEKLFTKKQCETRNLIQREFINLDYILKLMNASHLEASNNAKTLPTGIHNGLDRDFVGQTEVHAESFYCAAFRLKKMLKNGSFPEFKKLDLLLVTMIRNHVLEHTIVSRSGSAWTITGGPVLFVGGVIDKKHPKIKDRGFYPNALEFYAELQAVLTKALNKR